MQLTYRYRVKDRHARSLEAQAQAVNLVWNFCNETQKKAASNGRQAFTGYGLWKLVAGATKEGLDLHSHSAMRVCLQYDQSRRQHKKQWLRWRSSKSLGWIPFNTGHVRFIDGGFVFRKELYDVWLHRPLPDGAKIGAGSFSRDARGRWYINCPVDMPEPTQTPLKYAGADLGLKDIVTLSTGEKIAAPRLYRKSEKKLGQSMRARKSKRTRALHAKVANRRRDFLHKTSTKIAKKYGLIVVGDVSPSKLAQTKMAKSVLDAGWSRLKIMLSWKLRLRSGGMLLEVSERFTTQVCSECGSLPPSRPRGIAGLSKRIWRCDDCGTDHDRDVNAARNILRIGLDTLMGGTPSGGSSHDFKSDRTV